MKLELADIATNEKKQLKGFKILWIFPFYLRYITTATHIRLCKIKEQINEVSPDEPSIDDFSDSTLQSKVIPLINEYCVTALVNNRPFGFFFNWLLRSKVKKCGHAHILNLFLTIQKMNEPAFFLMYWKLIRKKENTLLKEAEQS